MCPSEGGSPNFKYQKQKIKWFLLPPLDNVNLLFFGARTITLGSFSSLRQYSATHILLRIYPMFSRAKLHPPKPSTKLALSGSFVKFLGLGKGGVFADVFFAALLRIFLLVHILSSCASAASATQTEKSLKQTLLGRPLLGWCPNTQPDAPMGPQAGGQWKPKRGPKWEAKWDPKW